MVNITIDNHTIAVPSGTTIMEAAASIHIPIPKLCYLKDINEIGACRVCVVEIEGQDHLVTSCNNVVEEGMTIYTNSPKVRRNRKHTVEMILSQHDAQCATCVRSGNCTLQTVANDLNIVDSPYKKEICIEEWDTRYPLVRDASKCVKCMRCIQVCDKIQGMHIWDVSGTGARTTVGVSENRDIKIADCALCGQCITHCPTGALRERDDTDKLYHALEDKDTIVVAQIAPAVRAAWGESLGLSREEATVEKIVDALRRIGVDYVFDTTWAADLTIMEEATEFQYRLEKHIAGDKDVKLPILTSCCPAWVKFIEQNYADMLDVPSSVKSPMQIFATVAKDLWAKDKGIPRDRLISVAIMPCIAKKYEASRPEFSRGMNYDVDYVITTRELIKIFEDSGINLNEIEDEEIDSIMGEYTGGGIIFGRTGGVIEAATRMAVEKMTGQKLEKVEFHELRGFDGFRSCDVEVNGLKLRIGVAHGLREAAKMLDKIRSGEEFYHAIEIMACTGGCVGGGGQPKAKKRVETLKQRAEGLNNIDSSLALRVSNENPYVQAIYDKYLDYPMSHKAHELLHTKYFVRVKNPKK